MLLGDAESAQLKDWTVKRLEDISDADSDVLADYVLALVKTEEADEQVRANCLENLQDFLQDHTAPFVNDVFNAIRRIQNRPKAPIESKSAPPEGPSPAPGSRGTNLGVGDGRPQLRKRGRADSMDSTSRPRDPHYANGSEGRRKKQPRGQRSGRGGLAGQSGGFAMPQPPQPAYLGHNSGDFEQMQGVPGDPVAAMMAMQAMGFPMPFPMPGMQNMPTPSRQGRFIAGQEKRRGRCRNYDNKGFCERGSTCPYEHVNTPILADKGSGYDPSSSSMQTEPFQPSSRSQSSRRHAKRAPFSGSGPNFDQSVTTIVVEQIPEENFTKQQVQDFFTQFGTIETIQMKPNKRLALVQYADHESAQRAWDSPKVIFDNRFVKVYWHKPDRPSINGNATQFRGAQNYPGSKAEDADEMAVDPVDLAQRQEEAQKAYEEKAAKREAADQARAEIEEKIKSQAEERRKLMEKLAAKEGTWSSSASEPQGDGETMDGVNGSASKTKTELLRAKLAELEAEAERIGLNPHEESMRGRGGFRGRGRGRGFDFSRGGRGSFTPRGGRGRGMWRGGGVKRLDNRPKSVAVGGIAEGSEKDEALRAFLFNNYEFDSIEPHPERKDAQVVAFKERYMAEKFIAESKTNALLAGADMGWVASAPAAPADSVKLADTEMDLADDTGPDFKQETDLAPNSDAVPKEEKEEKVEVDYDVAEEEVW